MKAYLLLLDLLASTVVGGCMLATAKKEYRDDFAIIKPVVGHTELVLDNINGTVSIAGVDGLQQVEITGVKIAKASTIESAKEEVARIRINVDASGPALRVKTEQPDGSLGVSYTVNYQIWVPRDWKVTVKNVNGDVKVRDIRNAAVATIVNGQLDVAGIEGSFDGEVRNGQIACDITPPANGTVKLETVNGQVTGKVRMAESVTLNAKSVNGEIDLAVPRSTSAKVNADVSVGNLNVSNLALAESKRSRNFTGEHVQGRLGSGTGSIDLAVQNGDIDLKGF
ncbi:MAG: DUF4097 family beta strand repeat-containing protein [Pyrinomonadaceae bacterium]